jgi:hypothetical protein
LPFQLLFAWKLSCLLQILPCVPKTKQKVVIFGVAIQCRNHATFCVSVVSVCPDVL